MKVSVVLATVAFLLCSLPAGAQSAEPVAVPLKGTFTVYVLDRSGGETEGKLVSLTDAAVTIQTKTTSRTFNLSEVVRIYRKGDSLKNGALIGAGVGLLTVVMSVGLADCPGDRYSGVQQSKSCVGSRVGLVLVGTATWAAIGTAIDALIPGRTLIWRSQPAGNAAGGLVLNVSRRTRSVFVGWRIK